MEPSPRRRPPESHKPPLPHQSHFTVSTSVALSNLRASILSPPPNPNPNLKPCNPNSAAKIRNSECSESETSIGSSNFDGIGSSSGRALRSTTHRIPLKDIGNRSPDAFGPHYCRKSAPEKTKDEGKRISLPLSIYSAEKTRVKGKPAAVPSEKTKDNVVMISKPISCTSIVNTRNKKKENIEPFSCPPLPGTRKRRTVSNEAGNLCISHSYTASQPKRNKKRRRDTLPQEFVEQQRAYFKEIDDFELAEEEVSENESG